MIRPDQRHFIPADCYWSTSACLAPLFIRWPRVFQIKKNPPSCGLSRFYRSPPTSPFSSPHLHLALYGSSSSSECSLRQASPASTHPPSVPGVGRGGTIACWVPATSSEPSLVRVSAASAAGEVLSGHVGSRSVVPAIGQDWCSDLVLPSTDVATVLPSSTGMFSPPSVVSVNLILTVRPLSLQPIYLQRQKKKLSSFF